MTREWRTRTKGTNRQRGKKFQLRPSSQKLKGRLKKVGNPHTQKKRSVFNYNRPRRIHPMLARRGTKAQLKDPDFVSQIKYDGTGVIIIKDGNQVKLMGARSWKNDYAERFPELVRAVQRIPVRRGVWHAELAFYSEKTGKESFLTALAKPETKEPYNAVLQVHDVLYVNNRNVKKEDYDSRLDILDDTIPNLKHMKRAKTFRSARSKIKNYLDALRQKREGVMLKDLDALYEEGVRSKGVLKLKKMYTTGHDSDDVVIVGVTKGKGKRAKTFGALILGQYDSKGNLVHIGSTSGFDDKTHRLLWLRLRRLERKSNPLAFTEIRNARFYTHPRIVVEVKYHEKTKHGHLRHPAFMRIRSDKSPKQCRVEG